MKKIIIFTLLLCLSSSLLESQRIKNYQGNIVVDPANKTVQATFTIHFEDLSKAKKIKLFVHKSAEIVRVFSKKDSLSYKITKESSMGEDKAIIIDTKKIKHKALSLQYHYSLESVENQNFIYNKNWIELNLYTTWFPLNINYGAFTYHIKIALPKTYTLISSGIVSNKGALWEVTQGTPFWDIPMIISPHFKKISVAKGRIKIYYLTLDKKIKKTLKRSSQKDYNRLGALLGNPSATNLVLAVNHFNREISYTRKGFISLSIKKYFKKTEEKILAHEIAHLWWNKAQGTTWEDWLNESFAEYSAMLLQREQYGEAYFKKNIKRLKERIAHLPSLNELKKENKKNQQTVTYKGAYLLYELENKIGRKSFEVLLKNIHQNKVATTDNLLSLLKQKWGIEIAKFVKNKLAK